ncbi:MAG: hypothetical protein M9905_03210 [Rhizobiaceae bacterium]|nr:hypothetical protein [Rhizobiaceae bacterium]
MLARRFTIVCLFAMVFGMAFASLIVDMEHKGGQRQAPAVMSCISGGACAIPHGR